MIKHGFHNITKKRLAQMKCKNYGAGMTVKIGDKICCGFVVNYSNLNGRSSSLDYNDVSLSLKMFVKKDGVLYELY